MPVLRWIPLFVSLAACASAPAPPVDFRRDPTNPVWMPPPPLPPEVRMGTYPAGDRGHADALVVIAERETRLGHLDDALRALDLALASAPGHERARYRKVLALAASHRADEAFTELDHLYRIGTDDALYLATRSRLEPAFQALRGDPRLLAVAAHFDIDAWQPLFEQLCAEPLRAARLVHAERGLGRWRDDGSADGVYEQLAAPEAFDALYRSLVEGPLCRRAPFEDLTTTPDDVVFVRTTPGVGIGRDDGVTRQWLHLRLHQGRHYAVLLAEGASGQRLEGDFARRAGAAERRAELTLWRP